MRITLPEIRKLLPNHMGHPIAGIVASLFIGLAIAQSSLRLPHMYLRQDPGLGAMILMTVGALLAILTKRNRWLVVMLLFGLTLWFFASILWSVAPANSLRAGLWLLMCTAVALVASTWPRLVLGSLLVVHIFIVVQGVDILLVSDTSYFRGVWNNKNVQGVELLLIAPALVAGTASLRRWSPYVACLLGSCLVLVVLTRSFSVQILTATALVGLGITYYRSAPSKHWPSIAACSFMLVIGIGLTLLLVRPTAVQFLGIGLGETVAGETLDKVNTSANLSHRIEMLTYGLDATRHTFPLGLGAGAMREAYPALKLQPGPNVADIHNYYVELLATTGPVGLALFASAVLVAFVSILSRRVWWLASTLIFFAGILAFDVPGYFPSLMMTFAGVLGAGTAIDALNNKKAPATDGALHKPLRYSPLSRRRYIGVTIALGALSLSLYWTMECTNTDCALGRRLAARDVVERVYLLDATPDEQLQLGKVSQRHYPLSTWPHVLTAEAHSRLGNDMAAQRQLEEAVLNLPYADFSLYVGWYRYAVATGDTGAAAMARSQGVQRFGQDPGDLD